MKKVLFIDRDGTLVVEPPVDKQLDSLEKLEFLPGVFAGLRQISKWTDFELVIVTNQDGLGTPSFPEETFWPAQNKMIKAFENEGISFSEVLIDRSFEYENSPNRKPRTGLLHQYLKGDYDLANSFVIGDRYTDIQLAENLGCKAIWVGKAEERSFNSEALVLGSTNWSEIAEFLIGVNRGAEISRKTSETDVYVNLKLNGSGKSQIETGLPFFDHMLDQIARHGMIDLIVSTKGDLEVDEHHTIEDTAIVMGEAFATALGNKVGIERYGYALPMDDCLAQVLIDFGGRNWLEWDVEFKREYIGQVPTEMFFHFFKSFTDGARCNLNIKAEGKNEHHKIEAVFKAFAKATKMAVKQDVERMVLPSTKGVL